jgi:hypothetical protein
MRKISSCLALAVAVILPGVAMAQTGSAKANDVAYCKALASRYMAQHPGTVLPSGAVSVAVSRCDTDPADSIKTLEAKLQGAGVTLPSREQAGRQQ